MNAREGGEEGEGGGVSRGEGCGRRELGEGERWVVELSATRSVKEGGGRVELDADGGARW